LLRVLDDEGVGIDDGGMAVVGDIRDELAAHPDKMKRVGSA
jgi:hypothetical protein